MSKLFGTSEATHVNALIDAKLSVPADNSLDSDPKLDQILGLLQSKTQVRLATGRVDRPVAITLGFDQPIKQRQGMCRTTGKLLVGLAHLKQSITDILTTGIDIRVMRRAYGSNVPDRVDDTGNNETLIKLYADAAVAIKKWEPRLALKRIQLVSLVQQGKLSLDLEGEYLGERITLEGVSL